MKSIKKDKKVALLLILIYFTIFFNYLGPSSSLIILNGNKVIQSNLTMNSLIDFPSKKINKLPDLIFQINTSEEMEGEFNAIYQLVNPLNTTKHDLQGRNVTIAIIDSGVNANNWTTNIVGKFSTTDNKSDVDDQDGHGSLVGSIVARIAPEANLVSIKVTNNSGTIKSEWVDNAFNLAKTLNVSIIHASIGSRNLSSFNYSLLQEIIAQNITLIVSAGNSGPFGQSIVTPAIFSEAISVGMVKNRTSIPLASSLGPRPLGNLGPDIVAPGVEIFGYNNNSEIVNDTGTSFAAPFVTGAAALLLEAFPNTSPALLKAVLQESAQFLNNTSPIIQGNGLLDISASYELLANINDNHPLITISPKRISSEFLYFGHSINGENRTYQLTVFNSLNSTLKGLNSTSMSPISVSTSNISDSMEEGFNFIDLSIYIPYNLTMSQYSENITFEFETVLDNETNSVLKDFLVSINNRYPGGNILFYQGYDNDTFIPDGPTGRYSLLQFILERGYGFNVWGGIKTENSYGPLKRVNSESINAEDLQKTQILILSDIEYGISDVEIDVIQEWVSKGHSLLIFSYPSYIYKGTEILSNQSSINRLLQAYGLNIVTDPYFNSSLTFERFNEATINNSYGIFNQNDLKFSYFGTSISVDYSKGARVLATAPDLRNENKAVPIAGFWEDPINKGKVVLFGGISSFDDSGLYNEENDKNLEVITGLVKWMIQSQQIRFNILLTSDPPQTGSSTQIQISFPEETSYYTNIPTFNGTIIEANGSYTQCTFKLKNNIYLAKWTPIASGNAVLWLNLQIQDKVPINGVLEFYVIERGSFDFLTIFLLSGFIFIAIIYYFLSTRKPIQTSPVEQRLYYEMSKKKSASKHKGLEIMSVCPVCKTPRYNDESKYCFKCGQEL